MPFRLKVRVRENEAGLFIVMKGAAVINELRAFATKVTLDALYVNFNLHEENAEKALFSLIKNINCYDLGLQRLNSREVMYYHPVGIFSFERDFDKNIAVVGFQIESIVPTFYTE